MTSKQTAASMLRQYIDKATFPTNMDKHSALQWIDELASSAPPQCLLQIAEPATAGTAVRAFRDYLGVHDGIKLGGQAMDDMALDLARIALDFKHLVEPQHPDDAAVDALAVLMKAKLAKQRAKGCGGWDTDCTQERLSDLLRTHVNKGDPVDVAKFCAFLAARGEMICLTDAELINAMEAHREAEHQRLLAAAPALYVSPEQLENHTDHLESEAGRYLPARKTAVGKFTMPLYAHPAEGVPAQAFKTKVFQALGIGSACNEDAVFVNIENARRRADCLSAIEREFFMVETPPDESEGDTEPGEECLLNWGHTPTQYVQQFAKALAATQPAAQGLDAKRLDFIENNSVSLEPEWEGPWTAMVYREHESPSVIVDGKTPRQAIDAAMAALAAQAKQGGAA